MLKKPIWNTIETTLFYYSGNSTSPQICKKPEINQNLTYLFHFSKLRVKYWMVSSMYLCLAFKRYRKAESKEANIRHWCNLVVCTSFLSQTKEKRYTLQLAEISRRGYSDQWLSGESKRQIQAWIVIEV